MLGLQPSIGYGTGGKIAWEELCWEGAPHFQVYTEELYWRIFTQRSLDTGRTLHTEPFTQRNFYTGKVLHTGAFTQSSFYTEKSLHKEVLTHRSLHTQRLPHLLRNLLRNRIEPDLALKKKPPRPSPETSSPTCFFLRRAVRRLAFGLFWLLWLWPNLFSLCRWHGSFRFFATPMSSAGTIYLCNSAGSCHGSSVKALQVL